MKSDEKDAIMPALLFGFDRDSFLAGVCIVLWYFASVSTVVLNKWLYQFVDFNYPFALTAIHMLTCWIGTYALLATQVLGIPLQQPEPGFILNRVFPLSFVFCVNITLGNISLQTIPVSFNQTIKAAVPACTVVLQTFIVGRKLAPGRYWSIGPIVGGVMLATFTEPNYHPIGFWTAAIGCWVTATWALLCGVYLKNLNPLNLLFYIAPWASAQLLLVSAFTEFPSIAAKGPLLEYFGAWRVFLLVLSGLFALLLNVASFFVIQKTSSLTYTVAGNFKVAFSIIVSVIIFKNEVTFLNAAGCLITIAGVWWYQSVKELPASGAKN